MDQATPEFASTPDQRQFIQDELARGVRSEDLADIGYQVDGQTPTELAAVADETEASAVTANPVVESTPVIETQSPERSKPVLPVRRLFEVPGLSRGRVNSYDQPVKPGHIQRGLSVRAIDNQHDINITGAASGHEILKNTKSPRA